MGFKCRLQELDQETRGLHYYLEPEDECWYIGDYTSHGGYSYGPINQLISNLKKHPSKSKTKPQEYKWKYRAVKQVANCFNQTLDLDVIENNITLVPIPPSKTPEHPDYDPRMEWICGEMIKGLKTPDACQLIVSTVDGEPTHLTGGSKPKPDEIKATLKLNMKADYTPRDTVLLLDDVLTTGSHFKACQELITDHFPEIEVAGLFVARTVQKEPDFDLFF